MPTCTPCVDCAEESCSPWHVWSLLAGTSVVDILNTRFRDGGFVNDLERTGVLVHMLDDIASSRDEPWLPCSSPSSWCYKYSDRCSASIINAALPYVFVQKESTGIVIAPWLARIMCSFFVDAGTMEPAKTCDTPGMTPTCLPGCWKGAPNWCDNEEKIWNCAWRPGQLGQMLVHHRERMNAGRRRLGALTYNEVTPAFA